MLFCHTSFKMRPRAKWREKMQTVSLSVSSSVSAASGRVFGIRKESFSFCSSPHLIFVPLIIHFILPPPNVLFRIPPPPLMLLLIVRLLLHLILPNSDSVFGCVLLTIYLRPYPSSPSTLSSTTISQRLCALHAPGTYRAQ